MATVEVERSEFPDANWLTFLCHGCGKSITLWYNDGELDQQKCCDYIYSIEHVRTDFVIYRETQP